LKKVFIHLGLHKTATSFLQMEIFPKLKDITYYFKPDILSTNFSGDKILISYEELSHTRIQPNNPSSLNYNYEMANKLSVLFPDADIIIGIRDKDSWIKSMYSRFLLEGSKLSFSKFCSSLNPDYINQDNYVKFLKDKFRRVYIYNFKDMVKYPKKIVTELCEFMDIDIPNFENKTYNISFSNNQKKVLRFMNIVGIRKIPGFKRLFKKGIRKSF